MVPRLLGFEKVGPITRLDPYLGLGWGVVVLLVLAAAAIIYVVALYRMERMLTKGRRIVLGVLRAVVLVLVLVLLFEPMLGVEMIADLPRTLLVLLDVSESMAIEDDRTSEEALKEAALGLGKISYAEAAEPLPEGVKADVAGVSRIEIAKAILSAPPEGPFARLSEDYKLRYFRFGRRLEPTAGEGEVLPNTLQASEATDPVTRLGSAIVEALGRYSGQSIAGIIVLTDGAANDGLAPMEAARRMQAARAPIYPIGLGLPDPPDVRVRRLIVQDTVFHKDEVPVRVELASNGFPGRTVNLTATVDGRKVAGKVVVLKGGPQIEEVTFVPGQKGGTVELEASVAPLAGETTLENNRVSRTLRVVDEKIKVLYVEGKPRWEYRYLRQVLLRDHRLEVKFLLTAGDRDLAETSERYLTDFPEEQADAYYHDLVVLGDVPASYFSGTQLERIEELVRERGGSFLMLAGHRYAPMSYLGTPIAKVLPVRLSGEGVPRSVEESIYPVVTEAGRASAFVSLQADEDRNQALWGLVRPMHKLAVLDGPKPAATVLAELSSRRGEEPYPLIAWQRYGSGKGLYIGTDQLWRLRFNRGDQFHARFWGQAIQFLTLSRLLGENRRIQIETDRREYRTGEQVQVTANVLNESFEPVRDDSYAVYLEVLGPRPETETLELQAVPDIAGLYQGVATPSREGSYRIRPGLAEQPYASDAEFAVKAAPLEQLEPAMQEDLLRRMAEVSGGRYVPVSELSELPEALAGEQRTITVRRQSELWDLWPVLVLVVLLLAIEWFVRRRHDLV